VAVSELLMTGAAEAAFTVIANEALPVPPALVAEIVTLLVSAALGVPVIAPVPVLMLKPAGRPVAPYEVGLPEAVIW
jgi:hypothetical protein